MKNLYLLILLLLCYSIRIVAQNSIIVDASGNNLKSKVISNIKLPLILLFDKTLKKGDTIYISLDGEKDVINKPLYDSIQKYEMTDFPGIYIREDSMMTKIGSSKIKLGNGVFYLGLNNKNFIGPIKIKAYKHNYNPGLIYYDALKLIEINNSKNDSLQSLGAKILNYYGVKNQSELKRNSFLNAEIKGIDLANYGKIESLTKELVSTFISTTTSSIGGLDVTTIADGFAKFIVKRTKQELSIAFFDKFKDELDNYPDIQTIFPQTYRALSAIGEDIYMYEAYIQTLRESFEKDLAALPSNLPGIIDNHKEYFDNNPEFKAELLSAFYIAQAIQDKQHPGNIIENFPIENFGNDTTIKGILQTLQLISGSLRGKNDSSYWAPYSDIIKLFADDQLLKVYLGLLEQKARNENIVFLNKYRNHIILADMIDKSFPEVSDYIFFIKGFALKTQSLETKIKGLKKVKRDSLLFENYYSVVSSSIDLMRYAVKVEDLPNIKNDSLGLKEKAAVYFDLAQTSSDIVIDVNRRNYSSAIVNAVHVYELLISKWNINIETQKMAESNITEVAKYGTNNIISFIVQHDYLPDSIIRKLNNTQLNNLQPYIDKLHYYNSYKQVFKKDAIDKIFKYGSFMAAIVQAKSSDEVEAAIEAVALPTGSARIKRESKYNVSLNAYCGIFAGQNRIEFWSKPEYSGGITAPIGIAVSWGHSWIPFTNCLKYGVSSTIFLSIIDLGAITAFRFTNDTSTVSKIQLKDIISPGLFVSWGLPKCPISINAGCQLTPLLASANSSGNISEARMFRLTLGICVDIPIINFYAKPRN